VESWRTEDAVIAARERFERGIPGYMRPCAYGVGVATVASSGSILDVWYPHVNTVEHPLPVAVLATVCEHASGTTTIWLSGAQLGRAIELLAPAEACDAFEHPNLRTWRHLERLARQPDPPGGSRRLVASFIGEFADPLVDACDAYLRLHLLSHRLIEPRTTNLAASSVI